MIKKYTIDGNYWEIIDKVVAEYKATDEYSCLLYTSPSPRDA